MLPAILPYLSLALMYMPPANQQAESSQAGLDPCRPLTPVHGSSECACGFFASLSAVRFLGVRGKGHFIHAQTFWGLGLYGPLHPVCMALVLLGEARRGRGPGTVGDLRIRLLSWLVVRVVGGSVPAFVWFLLSWAGGLLCVVLCSHA